MTKDPDSTVRIEFIKDDDYRLVPVTGAWGGISPQREVIVDFYVDRRSNPTSVEIETDQGKSKELSRIPDPQPIHRHVSFGVAMRPDIARSIGEFLIENADKALEGSES